MPDAAYIRADPHSSAAPTPALLTPAFMRQLDRLDVLSRKILRGKMQGERRSKQRGQSVEFADYRHYVVGDDLRFIDWNLYARLDKLFLRLFIEEQDLTISIAIDTTASMDYGEPNKLTYAKQLAAALGYIGLINYNRVNLYSFQDDITGTIRGLRGRRPIPRMLQFIERQTAGTNTANDARDENGPAGNLVEVGKRLALAQRQGGSGGGGGSGVIILISDFLDKGDLAQAFRYFAGDRLDVYAIQVLSPQEVDPISAGVTGDVRLRDVEDGDTAEISVSQALIKRYQATLQAYCQHVREQALRRGMAYLVSETSVPFEDLVLKYLRQRGLLG